ncbi:hypothetical protein Pcinc_018045 [Petrolisthes cinctipes]|uniref:RHD domain-containing protein n=1 Tax=Petrolisthes cinctipes TaxID=88211 RepID=A0AAE1FQ79_PETCI|nr:hypothetical protein Pcinc_018045 [Petrolisthes cinctipes]
MKGKDRESIVRLREYKSTGAGRVYGERNRGTKMGKVGCHTHHNTHSNSGVNSASRRRLMKGMCGSGSTSTSGGKKPRSGSSSVKLPPPPPPPPQSLVLDEDSGFGGDQSLDSESSLPGLPSPGVHPTSQVTSTALSLSGSSAQQLSSSLSQASSSTPVSLSASLSSAALAAATLGSTGSLATLSSILPSLAMVPQAKLLLVSLLQGSSCGAGGGNSQQQQPPSPPATTHKGQEGRDSSPSSVLHPSTTPEVHPKVVEKPRSSSLKKTTTVPGLVELGGEEAQELPTSSKASVPPLVSFRDVSLLSSIHNFKGNSGGSSLVCVEGSGGKLCGSKVGGKVGGGVNRPGVPSSPPSLSSQMSARSSDRTVELRLVSQPEEQHRARYQTEGSRGAVKDRSGSGHPTVKLMGFHKRTTLQVFVGWDTGKLGPHMFYQVCRVTGKNSTPCQERQIEGTAVIETVLEPENDMTMSCDCVGILKERNVDVEHRFNTAVSRGRKKSTKCRLVFRTFVTLPSGVIETLQVVSQPIACTQPPGIPEICRKSLSQCSVEGGEDLFILGKNFLKDAVVIFQRQGAKAHTIWEEKVLPDKDSLQPIHLVVKVPGYCDQSITEEVTVDVMVSSGGRTSEPHPLTYLPLPPPPQPQPPPPHSPVLLTKRELPHLTDTWEDKPLPKGVSPCALQLNRHYTETGTLPSPLPDFSPVPTTTNPSQSHVTTTQVSGGASSTTGIQALARAPAPAVRTSRVLLSPTKKMGVRGSRLSPRSSRAASTPAQSPAIAPALASTLAPPTLAPAPALTPNSNTTPSLNPVTIPSPTPTSSLQPAPISNPSMSLQTTAGTSQGMGLDQSVVELKHEDETVTEDGGIPGLQGGVSLEVLVEMLKVVQKFPTGSTIHNSVLLLVERLINSMRGQLTSQCKSEVKTGQDEPLPGYPSAAAPTHTLNLTPSSTLTLTGTSTPVVTMATTPIPTLGSLTKNEKCVSRGFATPPTVPLPSSTSLTLPATSTVSLLPFTVLSALPSTVCAGPKVARVAPVAPVAPMIPVAPTTVVSSPALARAVRVCVAEEPPLKKPREDDDTTVTEGYQLVATHHCPAAHISTPLSTTFTPSTNAFLTHKLSTSTHNTLTVSPPSVATPSTHHLAAAPLAPALYQQDLDTQNSDTHTQPQINLHTQNTVVQADINLQSTTTQSHMELHTQNTARHAHIDLHTQNTGTQAHLELHRQSAVTTQSQQHIDLQHHTHSTDQQPIVPSPLAPPTQSMGVQQTLTQQQQHNQPQPSLSVQQQSLNLEQHTSQQQQPQTMAMQQQNLGVSEQQQNLSMEQRTQQQSLTVSSLNNPSSSSGTGLSVQSNMPSQVSDPLLSQAPLCPMLPTSTPSSTSQSSLPTFTQAPASSSTALTRSDPLLSQSSPVTPLRIESSGSPPATSRSEGGGGVRTILASNPSTNTEVSMQNEVTSAINLSETELLNYFDPNCFDNV